MEKEPKLNELDKEKIKEATKERILSDAELIGGGADLEGDEIRLDVSDYQQKIIKLEHTEDADLEEMKYDLDAIGSRYFRGIEVGDALRLDTDELTEYTDKYSRLREKYDWPSNDFELRTYDGVITKFDDSNCMYKGDYCEGYTVMTLKLMDGTEKKFTFSNIKKLWKLKE
ncbi:MAG TPA: hypothetical protein VJK01_02135 [Candidatus Paceibacterota bacterium]